MLNFSDGNVRSLKCSAGTDECTLEVSGSENLGSGLREASCKTMIFKTVTTLQNFEAVCGVGSIVDLENVRVFLDVSD